MSNYTFKYRRGTKFWNTWKSIKGASGHEFDKDAGYMCIFLEEGGLRTILNWNECELSLGDDWFKSQLKAAEKKANQQIQVET